VDVAVDAARQRQQPRRIDLARRTFEMIGNGDDLAVANADIGAKLVAGPSRWCRREWRDRAASLVSPSLHHC
jgi:hypothetical protein